MASFRKGDKVSVTATVKYRYDDGNVGDVYLDIDGHYQSISIPASKLTLVQANFQVGDWVKWGDGLKSGQILALNESLAWVRCYQTAIHDTLHIGTIVHDDAPADFGAAA